MSTELWAAVIGSVLLIAGGGVGTLFWTHMSDLKKTAEEAQKAAADAQLDAALFAADLKRVELALYEHKLEVANRHIKREDFTPVLSCPRSSPRSRGCPNASTSSSKPSCAASRANKTAAG